MTIALLGNRIRKGETATAECKESGGTNCSVCIPQPSTLTGNKPPFMWLPVVWQSRQEGEKPNKYGPAHTLVNCYAPIPDHMTYYAYSHDLMKTVRLEPKLSKQYPIQVLVMTTLEHKRGFNSLPEFCCLSSLNELFSNKTTHSLWNLFHWKSMPEYA